MIYIVLYPITYLDVVRECIPAPRIRQEFETIGKEPVNA